MIIFIAIKHLIYIGIFFHYIFRHFQLPGKQPEFSFAFRFVDDELHQRQIIFGYDHLFSAVDHVDQF
jgi:hypothetical protein